MNRVAINLLLLGSLGLAGCNRAATQSAATGPSGGDVVPIQNGTGYAELLANSDTGELMVNTWAKDLKTRLPIAEVPWVVGSGEETMELMPHPVEGDPVGTCSRFYGHADWVRGGSMRRGWMHGGGVGDHKEFAWQNCWQAGRIHDHMWREMGEHRHLGPGRGPRHHEPGIEKH